MIVCTRGSVSLKEEAVVYLPFMVYTPIGSNLKCALQWVQSLRFTNNSTRELQGHT